VEWGKKGLSEGLERVAIKKCEKKGKEERLGNPYFLSLEVEKGVFGQRRKKRRWFQAGKKTDQGKLVMNKLKLVRRNPDGANFRHGGEGLVGNRKTENGSITQNPQY